MDPRVPKTNPAGSRPQPAGPARGGNQLGPMVRSKLADDPLWGYFALNGRWICPFCLSPVNRRAGKSREDSLAIHLEACRSFNGGRGAPQAADAVARRQQFENLVHLADSDPAWRVYDHTGTWICPFSLVRVPQVRLQGGQLSSFVYQAMAEHINRLPPQLRNGTPSPASVQLARDRAARFQVLVPAIQQNLQQASWRYLDPNGLWVCPCCLEHVMRVRVANDQDWLRGPEGMAEHLLYECTAYSQNPNAVNGEAEVRQAASQVVAIGSPTPTRGMAITPTGSTPITQQAPIARPAGSGAFMTTRTPTTRTPLPEQPRVAHPVTPTATRGVPVLRTPRPGIPVATPPGQRRTDTSPMGSPRVVAPGSTPPVAPPIVTPPPATPVAQDTLFGTLKQDFLNDTPLGTLGEGDKPQHEEAATDGEPGDLGWMDDMEAIGGNGKELPPSERTDMIKARAVQQGLMQEVPEIPGYHFAVSFEACADISGDFYQFVRLPDGRLGFALGDVSGHGVHAGLIMSMAKKTFEIYASTGLSPADTLSKVNDALARDLGGKFFISMVYALLDPTARTLTWARAGHNPSIRYNPANPEFEEIKPPGMVVGMKSGPMFRQSIQEQTTHLMSGDLILLYTDGVTETMNLQQEEFDTERLYDVIRKFAGDGPEKLIDRLMEILRHFRGPQPPADDSTLLALTVD
jgi:hypothetical protein